MNRGSNEKNGVQQKLNLAEYKRLKTATERETPPGSEDGTPFADRAKRGHKKVARYRTKAARMVHKLSAELDTANRAKEMYKRKYHRLQ